MKSEFFEQQIDRFIEDYLESFSENKKEMAKRVLEHLRIQLLKVISKHDSSDGFDAVGVNELCSVIDDEVKFFDGLVLENIGMSNLERDVLKARRSIKWQVVLGELKEKLLPNQPFSPAVIKRLSPELFSVIESSLGLESEERTVDWEGLADKLPEDMRKLYHAEIVDCEEKRRIIDEDIKEKIEELGIADAIASLSRDPKKLAQFLEISGLNLSETERARIVYISFAGLRNRSENKLDKLMVECEPLLGDVEVLSDIPDSTESSSVHLRVSVPDGARYLLVRGPWNRDIKVDGQKEVEFDVILTPGENNEIELLAYDYRLSDKEDGDVIKLRSNLEVVEIMHTGEPVNEDSLVDFLKNLKEGVLEDIQKDPERKKIFAKFLEESFVKQFAGDFEEGVRYVDEFIKRQNNPFVVRTIRGVLELFREIDAQKYPFIRESDEFGRPIDLLFFQKYCIYKIQEKRNAGERNVILANEPGLGKTLTALAALYEDEMLAVCPNSAASTWIEEEAKFFKSPFLLSLPGHEYKDRDRMLEERSEPGVLTNVQFLRTKKKEGETNLSRNIARRFELLNRRAYPDCQKTVVIDESHFLKNDSQQTDGVTFLESDFSLLLTASPYRDPGSLCRVMYRIFPDDQRFSSPSAFEKAFPKNDPEALKALFIMVQPYVIRFMKSDVLPTYDRSLPLDEQPISLPEKKYIEAVDNNTGLFQLTSEQEQAIFEMFLDWNGWTRKYEHYMPSDELAREDRIRENNNMLVKKHALRQIVNNPAYIGSDKPSPKHEAARRILEKELEEGSKIVIFCRYHNQVKAYADMLKGMGIQYSEFTGEMSEGDKKVLDEKNKPVKFLVDEFDNYVIDGNGQFVRAKRGQRSKTMLAIDYERLSFQNDPNARVCISTYSAGSQSVTFTAADAMIKDDFAEDYTEEYQSEDRIHRVDGNRRKYEVRYYNLVSTYSNEFLDEMRDTFIEEYDGDGEIIEYPDHEDRSAYNIWFANGTYDQVHANNLGAQKIAFEIINNGVPLDPSILPQEMPYTMS